MPATTTSLKEEAYRIRHGVYCEDLAFEPPRPDGMETDEYDGSALHVLMRHRPTDAFIACVRLVCVPRERPLEGLPFERICRHVNPGIVPVDPIRRLRIAEVSRLAVVREFRRRKGEMLQDSPGSESDLAGGPRQRFPHLLVGLYLGVIAAATLNEIERLFVLTEPRLAGHLNKLGVGIHQIGAPVEHRGVRVPSMIHVSSIHTGPRPTILPFYEHILESMRRGYAQQAGSHGAMA
ncbi:MAG: PEP-CTERM/exosortase system-associated acyltransferase [Burkholderiales bacterium]|nr:PEP-CTERM/exosortase system-associated acyltransferase [Burkholderiales bacterium]